MDFVGEIQWLSLRCELGEEVDMSTAYQRCPAPIFAFAFHRLLQAPRVRSSDNQIRRGSVLGAAG